jgi:HSP20 family molecular chaperone IbpA
MLDIVRRRKGETPTSPIVRLQDEMNDLFGRFFNFDWPFEGMRPTGWWPNLDVADKDDAVVVKVDVPGMKAQDIDISVQGNTLTITASARMPGKRRTATTTITANVVAARFAETSASGHRGRGQDRAQYRDGA